MTITEQLTVSLHPGIFWTTRQFLPRFRFLHSLCLDRLVSQFLAACNLTFLRSNLDNDSIAFPQPLKTSKKSLSLIQKIGFGKNDWSGHLHSLRDDERLLPKVTTLNLRPLRFCGSLEWPRCRSAIVAAAGGGSLERHSFKTTDIVPRLPGGPHLRTTKWYLDLARLISQTNYVVLFLKLLPELCSATTYSHFYNSTHMHSRKTSVVPTPSRKIRCFRSLVLVLSWFIVMIRRDAASDLTF